MIRPPADHVYLREELLYSDGVHIHLLGGARFDLSTSDGAVIDCVHHAESEFGLLCDSLAALGLGIGSQAINQSLRGIFSDSRSILELGPAPYTARPDVIVCDFDSSPTGIDGRSLVRQLRRSRRVLFLGIKKKVASTSRDSAWFEGMKARGVHGTWFRFVQWARSIIRFHTDARLILLGHRDAVLFGDIAARARTILILDPQWPSSVGCEDLIRERKVTIDPVEDLRALYYSLRFNSIEELSQINRNSSSAFGALELYVLRHAEIVCYSRADQVVGLREVLTSGQSLIPACLPEHKPRAATGSPRVLLIVADMECGAEPLVPMLDLLLRTQESAKLFDQIVVSTSNRGRFEVCGSHYRLSLEKLPSSEPYSCAVALIFPGLLREIGAAVHWMTSGVPTQIVRSANSHPLQDGLESVMFLEHITSDSVHQRLSALLTDGSACRLEVLHAQRRLARKWSVLDALNNLTTRATTPNEILDTGLAKIDKLRDDPLSSSCDSLQERPLTAYINEK